MAIKKHVAVDQIEVVSNGAVQVRSLVFIVENGKKISESFHRHVVAPGEDYSSEDNRVQAICAVIHTNEVISSYKAAIAAQGV